MPEVSPFKALRLAAGVSQAQLARNAGISPTAMTDLEAGMYDIVPIRANRALSAAVKNAAVDVQAIYRGYGGFDLNTAMDAWKTDRRRQVPLSEWPALSLQGLVDRFESPGSFCRRLCIPTAALNNTLSGRITMPDVIRDALAAAGYPYTSSVS